jgi:hypothetical protein
MNEIDLKNEKNHWSILCYFFQERERLLQVRRKHNKKYLGNASGFFFKSSNKKLKRMKQTH